jgi:hypothetical protein
VREAAKAALWRLTAERKELLELMRWSMRVGLEGQYPEQLEPHMRRAA